ncbi:acyl carrier protein [Vibrio owensii]|uniref:acyl carrier protein n=1 Tax=Vibrio harveyi group TaxID=717610 RepID=UPI003CC6C6BD
MIRENVSDKLAKIFVEQLGVTEKEARESNDLHDLGADSLDAVELVMAVEEDFEIEIPDEDAEKLLSFNSFVDYIVERTE